MGLFTYTVGGGALILIGAWESIVSASETLSQSQTSSSSSQLPSSSSENTKIRPSPAPASSSTVTFLSISVLSFLFIVNSLISVSDAAASKDHTGIALQLEVITAACLFLLYSLLGIFTNTKETFHFSRKILNLIYVFAFGEVFLSFYMQSKDPSGIENRYYDLALIPVAICAFSTVLELSNPKSSYPRLGRGIGFLLQGMWTLQMGFSFYSYLIANGCALHEKSRGNYTIKCKGHPEYHRGRAIATLQFNCHLAFLVTVLVGIYALVCKKNGISRESMRYTPLGDGRGMRSDNHAQFSLESDDEDDEGNGMKEVGSLEMQKAIVPVPESSVNGHNSHQ